MKQESIKLLQNNLDNLVTKYDLLIKNNNYNEALNVMKNIEIILRQLKELGVSAFTNEESDVKGKLLDWYAVLKFFIDTKQPQLIDLKYSPVDIQDKHRGTGKTTTLLRLSNDYNIPIFTDNYKLYEPELKRKASNLNLHITVLDYRMLNMKQYENIEILLVDENTNINNSSLRGNNILKIFIGFKNNIE
ncbi:MAG: hypothetical protein K0S41_2046 [Anaerocolumna sp.]|jgi:hypothetical protein|nr:hypothetical protein [Anaerocolumna sp.]